MDQCADSSSPEWHDETLGTEVSRRGGERRERKTSGGVRKISEERIFVDNGQGNKKATKKMIMRMWQLDCFLPSVDKTICRKGENDGNAFCKSGGL